MAKVILPAGYNQPATDEAVEIDLKSPGLAALLAWLVPGLGHVYQGRTGKGILFFVCVLGTFLYGMYLGEAKVVYASLPEAGSPRRVVDRWQYICQVGVGLPALPALLQALHDPSGEDPLLGSRFMAPPRERPFTLEDDSGNLTTQPDEVAKWTNMMHPNFELGTVYTVIAGLLNLLVICDAYAGPLVLAPKEKKGKPTPEPSTA